jgi:hypothetical protein
MHLSGAEPIAVRRSADLNGDVPVNDDLFEYGEDLMFEIVELSGDGGEEPLGGIEFAESPDLRDTMGDGLKMESDGVGTRSPAPKGNGAGPSIRP